MDIEKFKQVYSESRNGTDGFTRHPLSRGFIYSNGVEECAETGCYWLLDIMATELPGWFQKRTEHTCLVVVRVDAKGAATISFEFQDGVSAYTKPINWTDMPQGVWNFYVSREDGHLCCILVSEY